MQGDTVGVNEKRNSSILEVEVGRNKKNYWPGAENLYLTRDL